MKKIIEKFLKNKFNVVLLIVQVIAILFLILGSMWDFAYILAVILEGVFFVLLGIKMFINNSKIRYKESLMQNLPIQKQEMESIQKSNVRKIKSNKFQAILYILMGILLIFFPLF